MQSNYKCPLCHAPIAMDDVNVATDIALCRSCGRTTSFSVLINAPEISQETLANPPRTIKVHHDYPGVTTIVYRKLSPALYFLIPFTAIWSGGSMWGIYGNQIKQGHFDMGSSMFGLPFLIGTIVLLSIIAFLLFGNWTISLQQGEGTVFVGVGPLGWKRQFTYDRTTLVSMRMTDVRVNEVPQKGILIQNGSTDFVFGSMIAEDAKQYIAAAIIKEVQQI